MSVITLMAVSCDEKEEEPDALVGTYVFSSASFNDSVKITVEGYEVQFTPNSNAADFVGPGLMGAAPCADPQNAAIEMKSNGTVYYTCLTEASEEQMGTWIINSERTILTMNISNPQPFALTISGLDITATSFSGTVENFPLPIDAGEPLGTMLPGVGINYQTASVDLTFTRVP